MVTVAERDVTAVLAVTATFTVPLPLPEAGDAVHHVAPELTVTVHVALLVTAME
jgi:hypothetical protein